MNAQTAQENCQKPGGDFALDLGRSACSAGIGINIKRHNLSKFGVNAYRNIGVRLKVDPLATLRNA